MTKTSWFPSVLVITVVFILSPAFSAAPADADAPAQWASTTPPADGQLVRLSNSDDVGRIKTENGMSFTMTQAAGEPAVKAICAKSDGYPGISFAAPSGLWNLSAFGGVQVDVTNSGRLNAAIALRVDNPGDWHQNPWNGEVARLGPGQSKTIQVTFGTSFGAPGFALNPARVSRILIYIDHPAGDDQILIQHLKAYGNARMRDVQQVQPDGTVTSFDEQSGAGAVMEASGGASSKIIGKKLDVDFPTSQSAILLEPHARRWDLSMYQSVEVQITNEGQNAVNAIATVGDLSGDISTHSRKGSVQIQPQQTQTLTVDLGRAYGGPDGLVLCDVNAIRLSVDQAAGPARISVTKITAIKRQRADLPEWLGKRPPAAGNWKQTFNDDFNGNALDRTIWSTRRSWNGPADSDLQRYTDENVFVENGVLKIKCEKRSGHEYNDPKFGSRDYTTGMLSSMPTDGNKGWTQTYGYFETRMKLCTARGLWPAFWMMPDRGPAAGPQWVRESTSDGGMEVDICEVLSEWGDGRFNYAVHWDGYQENHKQIGSDQTYYLPTADGWHNWGLLWEPGKLTWFCDGQKKAEWASPRVGTIPMHFLYTVQMGGWATKKVDDSKLPDYLEVDYCRAWARQ